MVANSTGNCHLLLAEVTKPILFFYNRNNTNISMYKHRYSALLIFVSLLSGRPFANIEIEQKSNLIIINENYLNIMAVISIQRRRSSRCDKWQRRWLIGEPSSGASPPNWHQKWLQLLFFSYSVTVGKLRPAESPCGPPLQWMVAADRRPARATRGPHAGHHCFERSHLRREIEIIKR